MKLQVTISASKFDEDYEMALVYCFDKEKNYCFSLARSPDSEEIEIMVSDQIHHRVDDLLAVLGPGSIEVTLSNEVAIKLDGHTSYSIIFDPMETNIEELNKALEKIFEGKCGFKNKPIMNKPSGATLVALSMRLREITALPPVICKELLAPLAEDHRRRYVEWFEANPSSPLIDPIEVLPEYQELIATVRHEAEAKLERGELGDGRRGRSGRLWGWMQAELKARHQINWRTPLEMSPYIALD